MIEPFFNYGLTITSSYANDRDVEIVSMPLSQSLQSFESVVDDEEVSSRKILCGLFAYNEVSYASVI